MVGGLLLGLATVLMTLMLVHPQRIASLTWINTTEAWKILGAVVIVLLLPSVGRLKWGDVEIQSSPVETSPEIHLSPSEPHTAMEVLLQSSGRAASLLASAVPSTSRNVPSVPVGSDPPLVVDITHRQA